MGRSSVIQYCQKFLLENIGIRKTISYKTSIPAVEHVEKESVKPVNPFLESRKDIQELSRPPSVDESSKKTIIPETEEEEETKAEVIPPVEIQIPENSGEQKRLIRIIKKTEV